jgi:hypothetical protein
MAQQTINRETARRAATGARFVAIVMAMCGGAVAVFGVPFGRAVPEPVAAIPAPDEGASPELPAPEPFVDAGGIAMRLASVSNAPKPVIEAPEEGPASLPDDEGGAIAEAPTDEVGFLGFIREPGRTLALMRVNGRQVVMWVDRVVDGLKLVSISDDSVQVERDGVSWQVGRAPRKVSSVSRIDVPMAPAQAPDAGMESDDTREAAMNALRQNRMQGRDRSRMLNPGQGNRESRVNDPGRPWRED